MISRLIAIAALCAACAAGAASQSARLPASGYAIRPRAKTLA